MRHHQILIRQPQPVSRAGQQLNHDAFFAGRRLSGSGPLDAGRFLHGLVNTHGPSAVIATVCSKCAEYLPSSVTAVQ